MVEVCTLQSASLVCFVVKNADIQIFNLTNHIRYFYIT